MKKNIFKDRSLYAIFLSVVFSVVLVSGAVGAATTISSNINTGGTLTVTGATTLSGTLAVTGATTLDGNVTLGDDAADVITITGNATTQGTLTVGGDVSGTAVDRIFAGVCNFAATVTISASTTGYIICESATGVTDTDRVLVMATSSLPDNFIIQSASSTPTNGAISVLIYNTGYPVGTTDTGVRSLNYWVFR